MAERGGWEVRAELVVSVVIAGVAWLAGCVLDRRRAVR